MRLPLACLVIAVLTLVVGPFEAAKAAEFRANTFTLANQNRPAVAALSGGGFVAVWASEGQDGSGFGVYAQRYSKTGAAEGKEFRVSLSTAGDQKEPAVAGLSGGGFVVVWTSNHLDGVGDIFGQRYSAAGARLASQFQINTYKVGRQNRPAVAGLLNDLFVVAWGSNGQDGSDNGVYAQRFQANAAKIGKEFRVNTYTKGNQGGPAISRIGTGSAFVVAWESSQQDGESSGVYAQRYTEIGARTGAEFPVNVATAGGQGDPSIARLANGSFVIAFGSEKMQSDVWFQRYSAGGVKAGGNVRANTYVTLDQSQPSVAGLGTGGFIVIWSSQNQETATSGRGVYGQRYTAAGVKYGVEFRVNEKTALNQDNSSVAPWGAKGYVAIWESELQDGSEEGIFGKRFAQ